MVIDNSSGLRYKMKITVIQDLYNEHRLHIYAFDYPCYNLCIKALNYYKLIYKVYEVEIFDNFEQRVLYSKLFNNYT